MPNYSGRAWGTALTSDITDTTSTSLKAAVAGKRHYLTGVMVSNSHASVDTVVQILDGSTVIWSGPAVHGMGGYTSPPFNPPIPCTTNTAINAKCVTTGAAVRVAISGYTDN